MEIYQFKVTLIGITPLVWRRVHVPRDFSLAQLHRTLQVAMGWENYHLYMFCIGSKKYGPPDVDEDDNLGLMDAKRTRIRAVLPGVGATFTYVYDYGDNWHHELLLEAIVMPDPVATYPCCKAGERHCPPEDVGGIGGYAHYLEAMADPNHHDHEEMMMWRGSFDPEEFSVEKINQELAKRFRSKPKTDAPRAAIATPKLSAKANRLTKTFIRPVIPQRQRIPVKADETVPLELNHRERDLIISHTFADESLTDRLRIAPRPGQRPVFHFTLDEPDELIGDVAAEANHAKNKVLQEQLDQLCDRIEGTLNRYTDADA
jgi:Plasmid pRiA4b ORF-3-like protein